MIGTITTAATSVFIQFVGHHIADKTSAECIGRKYISLGVFKFGERIVQSFQVGTGPDNSLRMEFLTAPWHKLLFGKDVDKYALQHAEDSFLFLAYGCIVDEFQHRMYQNPDLTPDERNAVWLELEHKYRPWIDFDNLPFYGRGAGWQRQLHIYECPFYYIDYCLSTMAALQFFLLSLTDHKDAWERYLKLVRRAGLASYTELLETAGLKVPFEDGSIKGIAQQMTDWLEAHQV